MKHSISHTNETVSIKIEIEAPAFDGRVKYCSQCPCFSEVRNSTFDAIGRKMGYCSERNTLVNGAELSSRMMKLCEMMKLCDEVDSQ